MARARTDKRARRQRPTLANSAKVRAPEVDRTVPRERLFALLDQARSGAWLCGPGGAGKTSLTCSWLRARAIATVWLTLDAGDVDPEGFFASLRSASTSAALPVFDVRCAPALAGFAAGFFAVLFEALPSPAALVFDQCEQLPDSSPLHGALMAALDAAPPGVRVIMLSRRRAPAALARWRLDARFTEIDGDALRVDRAEAVALAQLVGADPARAEELNERVEGWAAGLRLLLSAPARELSGGNERALIFDYFATQVFARLSEATQSVLLCTSLLPWVRVRWAIELSGEPGAGDALAALCRDRMFVDARTDGSSRVYVFHSLLREFLLARVRRDRDDVRALTLRAAELLEADGALDEAARLRIEMRAWDTLVKQIELHAQASFEDGRGQRLEGWIEALPASLVHDRPALSYWRGVCAGLREPARGRLDLGRAYHAFLARGELPAALRCLGQLLQGFFVEWGEYTAIDPWLVELEARVAEHAEPWPDELLAASVGVLFRRPDHPLLDAFTHGQETQAASASEPELQLRMAMLAAQTSFWRGELARACAGLADVEASFEEASVGTQVMYALTCALLAWQSGRADSGLRWTERALTKCRDYGLGLFEASTHLLQSDCCLATGDLAAAERALTAGWSALSHGRQLERQQYKLNRALVHARSGRLAEARAWMRQVGEPRVDAPNFGALSMLTLAQLHLLLSEPERAEPLLTQALASSERSRADYLRWSVLIALACVRDDAAALLESAFALARERAYVSTFIWIPEQVARACDLALTLGVERAFVRNLISSRGLAAPAHASVHWPFPLRVQSLGAFAVFVRERALVAGRKEQRKPLELLRMLTAQPSLRARCTLLQAQLWPELDGAAARNAFDLALHRLRKRLGVEEALRLEEGELFLDRRWVWSDVAALEPACQRLERADQAELEEATSALFDVYQGEFLAGEESAWSHAPRERLRARLLRCLHEVVRKRPMSALPIQLWRRAVELDPLWDDAQRALMICLAQQQRTLEASESYRRFQLALARTHGAEPSPETRRAYARVLRGDCG